MAISLPPPIEPQLAPLAEVREGASVRVGIGPAVFFVADRCNLGVEGIREAALASATPSDFVRGLGNACYAEGYPAERTAYAVDDSTLYVSVDRGHVSELKLPDRFKPYFSSLAGDKITRQSTLELGRSLADSLSERGGENYVMRLEPIDKDAARLVIDGPTAGRNQSQLQAGFSTSGNRYSGRYLADAQLRHSWSFGTEITLGGVISVRPDALRDDTSGPYHEGSVSLSQITPVGVFGIDARYLDYAPIVPTMEANGNPVSARLDGNIREAALSWLKPVYASYNQRITLSLRGAHAEQKLDFRDQRLLTQHYDKVNLALATVSRFVIARSDVFELQTGLDLGHGFRESTFFPAGGASGNYSLVRPSLRLSYGPEARLTPSLSASAQYASTTLPQLEQLVLGGASLRAFEPGTASGDRGYTARFAIEHRWLGWQALSIKPTAFVEYGSASLRKPDPDIGEPAGTARRADAGIELILRLGTHAELSGYAAESISRSGPSSLSNDEHRLGARLSLSF